MEEQEHKQDYQSVTMVLTYQVLSWPVATCGCEACTLRKIAENKIQAFENKCARKLLRISWTRLLTAEEFYCVADKKQELVGRVNGSKLRFLCHVTKQED